MELKDKISILRKARGYSQQELGDRLSKSTYGISRQSIYDWEKGKSEPKLNNLRDLAELLDVSFDVLLDDSYDLNNQEVLKQVLLNEKENLINAPKINIDLRKRNILPHIALGSFLGLIFIGLIVISIIYGISVKEIPAPTEETIFGKLQELTSSLVTANNNINQMRTVLIALLIALPIFFIGGLFIFKIPTYKVVGYFSNEGIAFKENKLVYLPLSQIQDIKVIKKQLVITSSLRQYHLSHLLFPEEIMYSYQDLKQF